MANEHAVASFSSTVSSSLRPLTDKIMEYFIHLASAAALVECLPLGIYRPTESVLPARYNEPKPVEIEPKIDVPRWVSKAIGSDYRHPGWPSSYGSEMSKAKSWLRPSAAGSRLPKINIEINLYIYIYIFQFGRSRSVLNEQTADRPSA